MMLFDGKKFAAEKESELQEAVNSLRKRGIVPRLVTILVGDNPESILYLKLKANFAFRIGVNFELQQFPEYISAEEIISFIFSFNSDSKQSHVRGVTVQLPLPKSLEKDKQKVLDAIDPGLDIDGLTTASFELLKEGKKCFLPGVVRAVDKVMESYDLWKKVNLAAVVGAKGWVGSRIFWLLKNKGLKEILKIDQNDSLSDLGKADLIVSSVGKPNLIKADLVKKDAIVFDLGVMVVEEGDKRKTVGDVDFVNVAPKTSFITPVPGGIGPVTVASLFETLVENTIA